MRRFAVWLILLLAFFGLSDSVYLASSVDGGAPLICNIDGFSDCNIVAQSPYARMLGVPLSDFGVGFYSLLFILAAIELMYRHVYARRAIQGLAAVGLVASAYFMFLQFSIINALCIYCTISAGLSALIFILAYFIESLSAEPSLQSPPQNRSQLVLPPPAV